MFSAGNNGFKILQLSTFCTTLADSLPVLIQKLRAARGESADQQPTHSSTQKLPCKDPRPP
ncbi:hypothetical protein PtA15_10A263 [Puccinia triticina]|uniref:Uncharacterized protein n=1 Tax=Puccinia triticina TaxID=208348 RepID=A0ABY7CWW8_9BASI|nr:uncharacterized protein PtA15_10A263 [Puccinia triticina]WAQ88843.1 hypothetical protein PtA15_10A263 [Puccinia triticina]